jgi:hypothetical protein
VVVVSGLGFRLPDSRFLWCGEPMPETHRGATPKGRAAAMLFLG